LRILRLSPGPSHCHGIYTCEGLAGITGAIGCEATTGELMNSDNPAPEAKTRPSEPAGVTAASASATARPALWSYLSAFGLGGVLITGSAVLHIRSEYRNVMGQWQARQSSVADDRTQMVSEWLRERQFDARDVAAETALLRILSPGPERGRMLAPLTQKLDRNLECFAHAHGYLGVYVLDPQGRVVVHSTNAPELEVASLEASRLAARTGEARIELLGDVPDRRRLRFTYPVSAEETETDSARPTLPFVGAVLILADPVHMLFPQLMAQSVPTRTGEIVLLRREGNEVDYVAPLRLASIGATGMRRPFEAATLAGAAALAGREVFGQFRDYRGVPVLAATRRIPQTGWGLVTKIDRAEALADFHRMASFETLAAAGMLLALLGGLLLAYQGYTHSVAQRQERDRFRALVHATPQIVWTTNPQGEVEDIPEWRAFTGQSVEEVKGWGWKNALHPEDRERIATTWSEAVKNRSLFDTEYRLRRKDGEYRFVNARGVPVLNADGSVSQWVGFCADIHERKRAEEAFRQASAYNRSLLEASLDPLLTISPEGKVTDVNSATEKVTGRSRQELVGTDFSDYFTDPGKARAGYQQVFREGHVQDYELEARHRDGHITPVLYNASLYRDWAGQVVGIFAAARDIAERRKAEEDIRKLNDELAQRVRERTAKLEAANEELEAFTYSVSHDLRAPLRHVDGFSKLLVEEFDRHLPEQARHYVDRIQRGTRQMGQLVDDLLNLSRVGRGGLSIQITGLNSIVQEAVSELQAESPERKITWKIASLPFVECDPTLMKQALLNLLSNAVKFTRPRQEAVIEVGTRHYNGHEAVFVRDNGVGFNMKFADKLFGVFQRLHRPQDFEGTGVGLATVQRIVHKHGGRVWAEAELDRGATFYFTLATEPSAVGRKQEAA
jgi:PAS domain S-box-containing protein